MPVNSSTLTQFPIPSPTSPVGLFEYANEVTQVSGEGLFAPMVLLAIFYTAYLVGSFWPKERAFSTAAIITFFSTTFFYIMGLIGVNGIVLTTIMVLVTGFLLFRTTVE